MESAVAMNGTQPQMRLRSPAKRQRRLAGIAAVLQTSLVVRLALDGENAELPFLTPKTVPKIAKV